MAPRRITSTHRGCHINHNSPLPKGLACLCCRGRKVRCDGATPACSTCIRSAKYEGRDHTLIVCQYGSKRGRRQQSTSSSSGVESELDHSDHEMEDVAQKPLNITPTYLGDITAEPREMEQGLDTLASLLRAQLDTSSSSISHRASQPSIDSLYSSGSSVGSFDTYATQSPSSLSDTYPFFYDSEESTSLFFDSPAENATSEFPVSNSFDFSLPPLFEPSPQVVNLATLPPSGDYFTQFPADFALQLPASNSKILPFTPDSASDLSTPSRTLDGNFDFQWESWTAAQDWGAAP